ncbi:MAG TPA: hypothetical protein VGR85_01740 [Candidatus Limnocylindria bacterium]|nr:hypothetical protein [Candidatus Limnocylindria bacterium]
MNMPLAHEHVAGLAGGSPLYQIGAEHLAAVIALAALPIIAWLLRRGGMPTLAPIEWLLVALLAGSAAVHAGLAVGHDHGAGISALFVIDAALLGLIARRVWNGGRAGRLGTAVLVGSIGAYWISALRGEAPDQVGLATKLGEILALAIIVRPAPSMRARRLPSVAGSIAIALLVVGTATSSWIGAFRAAAAEPGAVAGHHVHGGSVAPPGTILPAAEDRDPTPGERGAAADLVAAARVALAPYVDPAVAAADGYRVNGLAGTDFHASNPANEHDDRVLDPAHPETLVYAVAPDGRPVLLGAMFLMPTIGRPGPTIGGPLTVWHAHQHVCISLTPPGLTGLLSPLGMCPVGSIDVPLTPEMIHIWIVPGAPQPFGDLDEAWKRAYLEAVASRP